MNNLSLRLKIIFGILAVMAGFFIVRVGSVFNNNVKTYDTTANISETVKNGDFKQEDPMTKDSDHDGLSDRDEIIYGTDPFNPDTDGDGFKDGEEIATGHDPLDPSDNPKSGPGGKSISLIWPTANMTDRLLNTSMASMVDNTGALDPQQMTAQKFADVIGGINNEAALYLKPLPLRDDDLKITQDNSKEAISKYINTLSGIIEEGMFAQANGVSGSSIEDILGISDSQNFYENKYNSLKIVEVPSSWKEIHKTTLNDLASLANSTKALTEKSIEDDPVKASLALNQVQSSFLSLVDILSSMTQLAIKQDVPLDSIMQMIKSTNSLLQSP